MSTSPAPQRSQVLLEVSGLTKLYGGEAALADVAFCVGAREVLGIVGPNGAGKTTLLESIAGIVPAERGAISWLGTPLPEPRRREMLFYLPDGVRPYRDQPVERVLEFFAQVYRRSKADLGDVIDTMSLGSVRSKRVSSLSKGFGRRLILALGLLTPHPLLLMDEPFDGFDLRQTRDVVGVLRGVAAKGRTLVLAIHQLADAERVCDRFILLSSGKIRGSGTLDELRARIGRPTGSLEEVFLALT